MWQKCIYDIATKSVFICQLEHANDTAPFMTLESISGALEKESSCERQGKISVFFFGNFIGPFSNSYGDVA